MPIKRPVSLRVHQLAEELAILSSTIIEKCRREGIVGLDTPTSPVSAGLAMTIREWFTRTDDDRNFEPLGLGAPPRMTAAPARPRNQDHFTGQFLTTNVAPLEGEATRQHAAIPSQPPSIPSDGGTQPLSLPTSKERTKGPGKAGTRKRRKSRNPGLELGRHAFAVFVGSTFIDLQQFRAAVHAALVQLEVIVRGMEQLGSRPGSPVDECLRLVRSCHVYIGIFAMRYGSIPYGFDRSMTHLEYDEAMRHGIPALIYIVDESTTSIQAGHIETGRGAERLAALKVELKSRHTVGFFRTPDDLQKRILCDLPRLLHERR